MSGRARGGSALTAAVIDIGSNSVLLLVARVDCDGRGAILDEALVTTRLGSGLRAGGTLAPDARERTAAAVAAFVARARERGAERIWAFATAAGREAEDGRGFADAVATATGIPVEILSAEREAVLARDAVHAGLGLGTEPVVVADVGGRTTELALGVGHATLAVASLPLGALALTEAYGSDVGALRLAVDAVLGGSDLPPRARALGGRCAASGGTATSLAALALGLATYDGPRVHGQRLRAAVLGPAAERLAAMPAAERAALPALDPGRAAVLPAGAVVLERLAAALGVDEIVVSDHGVRHAYLAAALGRDVDFRGRAP